MPSTSKPITQSGSATPGDPPFEEALRKLEAVVTAMESEELPLETLLARFEEGTRLAGICQRKLTAAELRIQKLELSAAGEMKLKPISPETLEDRP